jgi:glycosyltransferase involved in cell wall biosynthesis
MIPKATIMIPAYNAEKFIDEALESAMNQTYKGDYEILVVNDGSTDDTQGKIEWYQKKDSKIRLINQENGGSSSARNTLLENSRGEILFGLDADDLLNIEALNEIMLIYKNFSNINYIYTNQNEIDESGKEISLRNRENINKFSKTLSYNIHFQGHLKSFRKNAIGEKRFDKNLKSAVDWDFFLNLLPDLNVIHLPKVLYSYRMNENGISFTKREEVRDNSVNLIKKYLDAHDVYRGTEVEILKVKLKESLTYYDHLIDGKLIMKPEARNALERYLLEGY